MRINLLLSRDAVIRHKKDWPDMVASGSAEIIWNGDWLTYERYLTLAARDILLISQEDGIWEE